MGLSAPPLSALITPEPVRHSRIPELPLDSSLLFEFLLFLYLLVALFVQYINIYRTVWWYPYSHPAASTSLVRTRAPLRREEANLVFKKSRLFLSRLQNFHLMDYHLAIFITVMLARRLVWTVVSEVSPHAHAYARAHAAPVHPHMRHVPLRVCLNSPGCPCV